MSVLASPFVRGTRARLPFQIAGTRGYSGANWDRLVEDWSSPLTTGDAEMRTRIRTLRGRARELERNEPYSRRFLSRLTDNVYDHHGIAFASLAGEWRAKGQQEIAWVVDQLDAKSIELAYAEWKKNPFVSKDMTMNEGGRLSLRSAARDGDMLVRFVVDSSINDFGFGLQLLEADMCDDNKNELIRTQQPPLYGVPAQVRMGVEGDAFFAPTAYWILKGHPGDQQWWTAYGYDSARHEAKDFLHPYARTRITQCRDVTWLCGIMRDLKMLDGYDEAAIVAARTGAAKMGFITRGYNEAGPAYTGQDGEGSAGDVDPALGGDKAMDAEPGLIEDLSQSPGLKFEKWDPAYPHEQYSEFIKTRLRRIGAGLNVSYYAVANDLTDVNFSSIRAGVLEDREAYKTTQTWWINQYEAPIFLKFLEIGLLMGTIRNPVTGRAIPFSAHQKCKSHEFTPRRWPYVDPQKDVQANVLMIDNRLKTRDEVRKETGQGSFADVIEGQKREQEIAEKAGVELPIPGGGLKPEPESGDDGDSGGKPKAKAPKK